jgi:hypothetical protein
MTAIQPMFSAASPASAAANGQPPKIGGALVGPEGTTIEVRQISPAEAAQMLAHNDNNRKESTRAILTYARNMKEGRWRFVGDSIRLDIHGNLLDGQQRLRAIIDAGQPTWCIVVSGLDPSTQAVMDSGRKRTSTDQLRMHGYANHTLLGATIAILWRWDHGSLVGNNETPGTIDIVDYAATHPELAEPVRLAGQWQKDTKPITASVLAAVYNRAKQVDPQAAAEFFARLVNGDSLDSSHPILHLRKHMLRNRDTYDVRKYRREEWVYFLTSTWRLVRAGEKAQPIRLPEKGLTMSAIGDLA